MRSIAVLLCLWIASLNLEAQQFISAEVKKCVPHLLKQVQPKWPKPWAISRILKGNSTVAFEVDDSGSVVNFKFIKRTGHKDLDHAVEKAVRQWRYASSTGCNGTRSVEVTVFIDPR